MMDIQKEKIAIEIEHGFLIGADGADLATEFCNTYVREAMIEISGLSTKEAVSFVGSVAGQSLDYFFNTIADGIQLA